MWCGSYKWLKKSVGLCHPLGDNFSASLSKQPLVALLLCLVVILFLFLGCGVCEVALPLGIGDAAECGMGGNFGKLLLVGLCKVLEIGDTVVADVYGCLCVGVVGADLLTDVAAEGEAAEFLVGGQVAVFVFDGVEGGTTSGIEHKHAVLQEKSFVWASIETASAAATAVLEGGVVVVGDGGSDNFADVAETAP